MAKKKWKKEKIRSAGSAKSRDKKILLVAVCIVALLLLLLWAVPAAIRHFNQPKPGEEKEYHFYPIVEDEDIFADKVYMSLDRTPYFENPHEGITISFSKDNLSDIPEECKLPVDILLRYVEYATNGQTEELNALFSEKYTKSGFRKKEEFTPQKIYDIKFSYYLRDEITEPEGTWPMWQFWVEYKIRQNNGTFRNDMDSDCTRRELFEITYRDGKVEIDGVAPYRIKK